MQQAIRIGVTIALLLFGVLNTKGQFVYFNEAVDFENTSQTLQNCIYSDSGNYLFATRGNYISNFGGIIALATMDVQGNVIDSVKYTRENAGYNFGHLINMPDTNGYVFIGTERLYHDSVNYTNADALIIRYNQDKSISWVKQAGEFNRYDLCFGGFLSSDGGFLAVAQAGDSLQTTADIALMKLNSAGNTEWIQYYGGNQYEAADSGIETPDGGYMVLGWTRSFGAGQRDFYLVKTDSFGNQEWQETYGYQSEEVGSCIIALEDGNYLLTGSSGASGQSIGLVYKINPSGDVIWTKQYSFPGNSGNNLNDTKELADGNIIHAGLTDVFNQGNAGWLVKSDSAGNLLWQRKYNYNEFTDLFYGVLPTTDGGFLLSGQCYNADINSQDAWLLKVDSVGCTYENCIVGIEETEKKVVADVWPTPTSDILNIELQELEQNYKAVVLDMQGREVLQEQLTAKLTQLDVATLSNGVYVLSLSNSSTFTAVRFVVQH